MHVDEEIEQLDKRLRQFRQQHPGVAAKLRISRLALLGCMQSEWANHGWTAIRPDELWAIGHGNEEERAAAFKSLLSVADVEHVGEVDVIEVVEASPQSLGLDDDTIPKL